MLHRSAKKVPPSQVDHRYWMLVLRRSAVACVLAGAGALLLALTASPAAAPTRPFAPMGSFEGDMYALVLPTTETTTVPAPSSPVYTPATPSEATPSEAPEPVPDSPVLVEVAPASESAAGAALPTTEVMPAAEAPTPTLFVENTAEPAAALPTLTAAPTDMSEPTATPTVPTGTPTALPDAAPPEASPPTLEPAVPPARPEDLVALELFLRLHRDTVGGQRFEIVSLRWEIVNETTPRYVLEVVASEAADVFAAQAVEYLVDYGRLLLDDVIRYLGGTSCEITVESTYTTTDPAACLQAREWCVTGASDAPGVSTLTWTYLRGRHTGEVDAVEAWSATP